MTEEEIEKVYERTEYIHGIYHAFCDYMKQWYHDSDGNFDSHELIGYEAAERVEEYAKDHPEIQIAYCDDDVFSSSIIAFIPHPDMGVSIIFIPQCCSTLNQFFLYPNHLEYLLEKLNEIKRLF
jgi:hypothetical protein